jgi:hypothetical protein
VRSDAVAVGTYRYRSQRSDELLRARLVELAREEPRYGYRCWREWERLMQLQRRLAAPIGSPSYSQPCGMRGRSEVNEQFTRCDISHRGQAPVRIQERLSIPPLARLVAVSSRDPAFTAAALA